MTRRRRSSRPERRRAGRMPARSGRAPLAAGVGDGAVLAGAEETVDATGGAEVLDPQLDAHGSHSEDGIEELDVEVANDVYLVGIIGVIDLPLSAILLVPRRDGALDVRGEAGVVQHLHGVELVEVDEGD